MKAFILLLLTLFLGLLIFLKFEYNAATKTAINVEKEYFTQEYTIIKIDESGYYGKNEDGKSIYFKKEHLPDGQNLQVDETVLVYFNKHERRDGLVKVEKKE